MEISVTKVENIAKYAQELNRALREGLGIAFHNNGGLIARNPEGIKVSNWDLVASFNHWGECPKCYKGVVATFCGIDGPFMEDLFFEEDGKIFVGYRNRIKIPEVEMTGLRTISINKREVPQFDTEYGPYIGKLKGLEEHVHEGQIQAYEFTPITRVALA
jgi:hypothetical protein